jgi:membrane protein implicated in regulation of membrane protease activity
VLLVYLASLVIAAGVLVMQIVLGHHAEAQTGEHAIGDHDAPLWTLFASVRFWAFALLGFGTVGTIITAFGFASFVHTLAIAIACGIGSGLFAVLAIRKVAQKSSSSHATGSDVVGRVGRVIVPPNEAGRCKIRVEIKGSSIDYVATASETMAEGDAVLVEEGEGENLLVSKAPRELGP